MVAVDQQNLLDDVLLEAHLVELVQEIQKLFRLWKCIRDILLVFLESFSR